MIVTTKTMYIQQSSLHRERRDKFHYLLWALYALKKFSKFSAQQLRSLWPPPLDRRLWLDCKTVRIFAWAVKQKVGNEAENRERGWGETLRIRTVRFAYVIFVRITRLSQPRAIPIGLISMQDVTKLSSNVQQVIRDIPYRDELLKLSL